MKMHRYEEIWLVLAVIVIIGSMIITGYEKFAEGMGPPSGKETIDPEKVDETAPFDEPGVFKVGENEYDVVMTLQIFSFTPGEIEVPKGAKVNFIMTSKDVIHGIQVVDTNINAMVVPGHVQEISQTFDEPGEYLILCNEYCGSGHQMMSATSTVKYTNVRRVIIIWKLELMISILIKKRSVEKKNKRWRTSPKMHGTP